jgi:hypothetical protein
MNFTGNKQFKCYNIKKLKLDAENAREKLHRFNYVTHAISNTQNKQTFFKWDHLRLGYISKVTIG